jgi:hypothetical protein
MTVTIDFCCSRIRPQAEMSIMLRHAAVAIMINQYAAIGFLLVPSMRCARVTPTI